MSTIASNLKSELTVQRCRIADLTLQSSALYAQVRIVEAELKYRRQLARRLSNCLVAVAPEETLAESAVNWESQVGPADDESKFGNFDIPL